MGLARSIVKYSTIVANNANTPITNHYFRLMAGVVNPPTKLMAKASIINNNEIGFGIPAFNIASLLMPKSNKVVKFKAIAAEGTLKSFLFEQSTVVAHKAFAVLDSSSLFFLNLS